MSEKHTSKDKQNKRVQLDVEDNNSSSNSRTENTSSRQAKATQSAKLASEIHHVIENFGKCNSEPVFKNEELKQKSSTSSVLLKHLTYTESVTKCSAERLHDNDSENVKGSSDETTLDGKIIICSESPICPNDCHCRHCDQSLADVEPLPAHYEADKPPENNKSEKNKTRQHIKSQKHPSRTSLASFKKLKSLYSRKRDIGMPLKKDTFKRDKTSSNIRKINHAGFNKYVYGSNNEKQEHGYADRYNYNHISITRGQSDQYRNSYLEKIFSKKKKNKYRNMCSSSHFIHENHKYDSGTTIPQLYKAKMKQLEGNVPERFTFKAVTGSSPNINNYTTSKDYFLCPCQQDSFYIPGQKIREDSNPGPDDFSYKAYNVQQTKSQKFTHTLELPNPKACLNFDGNEYISSGELPERIDIYCFDHLNTSYFRTSDQPPPLITEVAMERTEALATRFWAEIFGFVHIMYSL